MHSMCQTLPSKMNYCLRGPWASALLYCITGETGEVPQLSIKKDKHYSTQKSLRTPKLPAHCALTCYSQHCQHSSFDIFQILLDSYTKLVLTPVVPASSEINNFRHVFVFFSFLGTAGTYKHLRSLSPLWQPTLNCLVRLNRMSPLTWCSKYSRGEPSSRRRTNSAGQGAKLAILVSWPLVAGGNYKPILEFCGTLNHYHAY